MTVVPQSRCFAFNHVTDTASLKQESAYTKRELFARLEFQTLHLGVSRENLDAAFAKQLTARFKMTWSTAYTASLSQVAILLSK